MSDLPQLLEGNRRFAAHFADGELPIRPRLSTVVLTCLDARVDPAHLFDLQLGDALVIRNGGGRINVLNRDSPDGSSQSPTMVAQWACGCESDPELSR